MKWYRFAFLFMALWAGLPLFAEVDPALDARLEKRWHTFQETTLPYRLYVPENHSLERVPLLLFLHGARWSGSDNVTQLDNELAVFWVQDSIQTRFPSFVLIPQCPSGRSWETVSGEGVSFPLNPILETVKDLLDSLTSEFAFDPDRIYIAGKSMGGQGVYGMLFRYPDCFAAAVIAAGPHVYGNLEALSGIPLWIFHAKNDETVSVNESREVVEGLESLGHPFIYTHCNFHEDHCLQMPDEEIEEAIQGGSRNFYTEFDTSGHQIEPLVVRVYGLSAWMFTQDKQRTGFRPILPRSVGFFLNYPNPFNPRTRIQYALGAGCPVRIRILDILGRELIVLTDERQEAGVHSIGFDGRNLTSGIYLAELKAGNTLRRIKIILIK